jgi:hypothetical protein
MERLTGQALIDLHTTMREQGYGMNKIALDAGYSYYNQTHGLWKIAYTSFYEELLYAKGLVNRIIVKVKRPDSYVVDTYTTTVGKSYSERYKVMRAKELAGYGKKKCDRNGLSTTGRIILNCRADKATIVIEIN